MTVVRLDSVIDAINKEPELTTNPMPWRLRLFILFHPAAVLRATVRCTKKGILDRVQKDIPHYEE